MREVSKVESVTCDWCEGKVGVEGLNKGKAVFPVREEDEMLEIRLVVPGARKGQTFTCAEKDICLDCWLGVLNKGRGESK